ncbi:Serine/threonine-protein kinase SKY1 [Diaporthe amygdali]|uniref:Serine/threonine-protein kinase SKY1 n=1 Tax=Phomopsis amygdali TaxID=1214568 RepID=UPI0022FE20F5|nr:Serine/threonine-protein kinase SKY1 [Diaporthe amygdali]KAJ0122612.1 Serine/threonine-protein kinase SKY1 [Diaporthe amygdali]
MVEWTEDLYPNATNIQPHEPPEDYRQGGLHPVALGDTFQDGRFVVRHKLGFGGQATVWLVQDTQYSQWASLKIKQSRISEGPLEQDQEIQALQALEKYYASSDQKAPRCFTRLLTTFQVCGPNGTHNCLVTELVGPSVAKVVRACSLFGETLRPDTVLRASKRVLQGVDFAHHAGIVHGDVSFGNVAFTCDVALNGEEDIFVALGGQPMTSTNNGREALPPNMPRMLVKTADWDMWTDRDEEDIRLLDWGLAFPVTQAVTSLPQPIDLRSPETFFCASIDFRHDLWRAGCVIYVLYFQQSPFPFRHGTDREFIGKLVEKLGALPPQWNLMWEEMEGPSANHQLNGHDSEDKEAFEERRKAIVTECQKEDEYEADEYSDYDFESLQLLSPAITALLKWEPERRVSAQQALSFLEWVDYRNEA